MCIMEMNPEQHKAVMYQAVAHNLSTVDRDVDLLIATLAGRRDVSPGEMQIIERAQSEAHRSYANMLNLYTAACGAYAADENGHVHHNHDHSVIGAERSILSVQEVAVKMTEQAHPYETR